MGIEYMPTLLGFLDISRSESFAPFSLASISMVEMHTFL